jgi:hydrogenase small subunit
MGIIAAALSLPEEVLMGAFTRSLAKTPRLPVLWLAFQDCAGDTESLLRSGERSNLIRRDIVDPGIVDLLLEVISVEYHETLMAPAGAPAEALRRNAIAKHRGKYLAIVEGSIPTAENGVYCMINGRTALSLAEEVCGSAWATLAVGTCATSGGLPAAQPNPTGAKGLLEACPSLKNVVNIPGCPANGVNLVSTMVYLIAFNELPALDNLRRPTFAFGRRVHDECPRHRRGKARAWGDASYCAGGCLEELGCRGPQTRTNCATVKWNGQTCWPIEAGHGCIGCTEAGFWDRMAPFHVRGASGRRRALF